MTLTDWTEVAQLISAIAAAGATIFAAITIKQNSKERHAMVKPIFMVKMVSEDRIKKQYTYTLKNIGYDRISNIECYWEGITEGRIVFSNNENIALSVSVDLSKLKNIKDGHQGNVSIVFFDILGKRYDKHIRVELKSYDSSGEMLYCLVDNYSNRIL